MGSTPIAANFQHSHEQAEGYFSLPPKYVVVLKAF